MKAFDKDLSSELKYATSRSSGKGGQHVNKTSTKVELYFDIGGSYELTKKEQSILLKKLKNTIDKNGVLRMTCDEERSQKQNKKIVTKRFYKKVAKALAKPKKRIPTKPSLASKKKRLKSKKMLSEKKENRKKLF